MNKMALRGLLVFAVVAALAYYQWGLLGFLAAVAAFAGVFARNIVELGGEIRTHSRRFRFSEINGQYYSFQGTEVHVVEDDDYCQWVPANDVRKIVGQGASDRMLALAYPDGWCVLGKPPKGYLRDDALMMYLAKDTSLRGIKFKVWVERTIALQAGKRRQRFGIRISDPRAPDLQPNHLRDTDVPRDMRSTLPQA